MLLQRQHQLSNPLGWSASGQLGPRARFGRRDRKQGKETGPEPLIATPSAPSAWRSQGQAWRTLGLPSRPTTDLQIVCAGAGKWSLPGRGGPARDPAQALAAVLTKSSSRFQGRSRRAVRGNGHRPQGVERSPFGVLISSTTPVEQGRVGTAELAGPPELKGLHRSPPPKSRAGCRQPDRKGTSEPEKFPCAQGLQVVAKSAPDPITGSGPSRVAAASLEPPARPAPTGMRGLHGGIWGTFKDQGYEIILTFQGSVALGLNMIVGQNAPRKPVFWTSKAAAPVASRC